MCQFMWHCATSSQILLKATTTTTSTEFTSIFTLAGNRETPTYVSPGITWCSFSLNCPPQKKQTQRRHLGRGPCRVGVFLSAEPTDPAVAWSPRQMPPPSQVSRLRWTRTEKRELARFGVVFGMLFLWFRPFLGVHWFWADVLF